MSELSKLRMWHREGKYSDADFIYRVTQSVGCSGSVTERRSYFKMMREFIPTLTFPLLVGKPPYKEKWFTPYHLYEFIGIYMFSDAVEFVDWMKGHITELETTEGAPVEILNIQQTTSGLIQFLADRSDVHASDFQGLFSYHPVLPRHAIGLDFVEDVTIPLAKLGLISLSGGNDAAITKTGLFALAAMRHAAGVSPTGSTQQPDPSVDLPF